MKSDQTIKILFAASEAEPFYKVGGLGDYAGSLPLALKSHFTHNGEQLDMRVVLPLHDPHTISKFQLHKLLDLTIPGKKTENLCRIYFRKYENIPHYFIHQLIPKLESHAVYAPDQYQTAYKFALFSITVVQMLEAMGWRPDLIHTNDWHTALINYLVGKQKPINNKKPKTILTIHNMPFMGYGSEPVYDEFGIQPVSEQAFPSWAKYLPLPMGIAEADQIVAVSPSYAKELTTQNFAYGIEKYFLAHTEKLCGIINGIDYEKWDPAQDPIISSNYSSGNLASRMKNKSKLFAEIGFKIPEKEPLLVVISRLESQKGIDLILDAMSETAGRKWKAVILGSGHHGYEYAFRALERVFPDKIHTVIEYNPQLARKLYAAGDMILMPSLYEPCGLSQMIAMRYGCIPIAHAVGGLKDSIITKPKTKRTGYLFKPATKSAFITCLKKALRDYSDTAAWKKIQSNAMRFDFSWFRSAANYADIYKQLIK